MRLNRSRSIALALLLIIGFFILANLTAPKRKNAIPTANTTAVNEAKDSATEETATTHPETDSQFELSNFQRSENKDGKKVWEVTAAKGRYFPEKELTTLYDAKIISMKNETPYTIKAKEADVRLVGETIESADIRGSVEATLQNGVTVYTETAYYNHSKQEVTAPSAVKIEGEFYVSIGDTMNVDIETQTIELKGNVRTILEPVTKEE